MESTQSQKADSPQKFFLRLIPGKSATGPKCNMFAVRDATEAQLLTGSHWGDDYLIIDGEDQLAIIKEILDEADYPYEEVKKLPPHHVWALD